ncbi:MAG: hypothetical protein WEB00_12105 [Dehalococcoidia bacterium]
MPPPTTVALGFRHHTGWAVAVAIAGPADAPRLVLRRRISLCEGDYPREAYHVASLLPADGARDLIAGATEAAALEARRELRLLCNELARLGFEATTAGLAAEPRQLPPLAQIMKVHILRHSAEGEMFRAAIADACSDAGLAVVHIPPKQAMEEAAEQLGLPETELSAALERIGREAGPPWQQDQRLASLVAVVAAAQRSPS